MHRDIKSTRTPVYLSDWQRLLEFTKLLRPVVAWLRQQGVKLHVYLDNWLICAESPEQAQMHSEMTIALHPRLGWVINFEKSDLTPSQEFQFLGMHFNTGQFTVAPLPKMHLKVQSALDEQPHHHSKRSTQVAGHGGVHGNAGTLWKVTTLTSPVVGCHSMVPEDRELDRQDHSSSVGSTRSGLVGITSSPARSSPRHSGNGSHAVHRCVQLRLGSPTRLMLDSGTVVSI